MIPLNAYWPAVLSPTVSHIRTFRCYELNKLAAKQPHLPSSFALCSPCHIFRTCGLIRGQNNRPQQVDDAIIALTTKRAMIPILDLFETHLTVGNLKRSMPFYESTLGLEIAQFLPDRKIAFCWIGGRGNSMLGLWQAQPGSQPQPLHIAFRVDLSDMLKAHERLRAANIAPLDFDRNPTTEPVVLAWMPAASLYFHDPDGHLLEFISMLPDSPEPDLGVVTWSTWKNRPATAQPRRPNLTPKFKSFSGHRLAPAYGTPLR
jgi:lactoylglutathione lyase